MDDKIFDEKIKKAILKGTDNAANSKEELWHKIQQDISVSTVNKNGGITMKKGRTRYFGMTAAAATLALTLLFGTAPGQAAVDKIKEILVPEKVIVEELEGQKENTKVSLKENVEAGYSIYFDEEKYAMEKNEGKDRIVALMQPTGDYPEVFMEISQIKDKNPQDVAAQVKKDLEAVFPDVRDVTAVENPVQGFMLVGVEGLKHNSTLVKYYFLDNLKGGTFVIQQQMFIEAEEGHGMRFDNMLKEFRIEE